MKVLKHGSKYRENVIYKIDCKCGCEYEVCRSEVINDFRYDHTAGMCYYIKCPECNKSAEFKYAAEDVNLFNRQRTYRIL